MNFYAHGLWGLKRPVGSRNPRLLLGTFNGKRVAALGGTRARPHTATSTCIDVAPCMAPCVPVSVQREGHAGSQHAPAASQKGDLGARLTRQNHAEYRLFGRREPWGFEERIAMLFISTYKPHHQTQKHSAFGLFSTWPSVKTTGPSAVTATMCSNLGANGEGTSALGGRDKRNDFSKDESWNSLCCSRSIQCDDSPPIL